MTYLVDIQTAFPDNYYTQKDLIDVMKKSWSEKLKNLDRLESIHQNVLVKGRHLALPVESYLQEMNFDEKNQHFIDNAVKLATKAIEQLVAKYKIDYNEINSLWSNTVTGFAIPSLEARVMNVLPFNRSVKRMPLMGLGCMAGVAGINRAAEYLKGHPHEAIIYFSVELCSLTFQNKDISAANIVSTGLFGDGAAAVLLVGDKHPLKAKAKMRFIDAKSAFFPDTPDVMGWQVGQEGLKIILSKGVPELTESEIPKVVDSFLKEHNLHRSDVSTYLAHPGGPKVLLAMEKALDMPQGGLKKSWQSLAENGNMSSVSVLDIINRSLQEEHESGDYALAIAMGPAFSAEVGLFQWI